MGSPGGRSGRLSVPIPQEKVSQRPEYHRSPSARGGIRDVLDFFLAGVQPPRSMTHQGFFQPSEGRDAQRNSR